jgi:Mrp family chromosome partitioning ATPase
MDANLKVPSSHLQFDLHAASALAVPESGSDVVRPVSGTSLWIVSAPRIKDGRPIVAPDAIRSAVKELRKRFRFLLISAPPLGNGSESLLLGKVADGVVLTILAESTERAAVRKVRSDLEEYKIRLLGAVLNRRPAREKSSEIDEKNEMN